MFRFQSFLPWRFRIARHGGYQVAIVGADLVDHIGHLLLEFLLIHRFQVVRKRWNKARDLTATTSIVEFGLPIRR